MRSFGPVAALRSGSLEAHPCPVEATALGNVLVQARTAGAVTGGLDALRRLVAQTQDIARYDPLPTRSAGGRSTR